MKKILISWTVPLICFMFLAVSLNAQETGTGDKIDHFTAITDEGTAWKSTDHFPDKIHVVYFYPAAMTGGCTKQACSYRDEKANLDKYNVEVIGISGDDHENLKYFKQAHDLNFTLLSDQNGNIAKAFGVPTGDGGEITREIGGKEVKLHRNLTTSRWTFIVDREGTVIYKNEQVNAAEDPKDILKFLEGYREK